MKLESEADQIHQPKLHPVTDSKMHNNSFSDVCQLL
jgi:hypothetical protein